ncbi:unnamed protein product, partial [Onchocerca flexuosa]|uniref:Uncharacterized protein n=1 Tax=Onchocerca flexuosa TaxID=387005 RepID=A0A183HG64_9BILA
MRRSKDLGFSWSISEIEWKKKKLNEIMDINVGIDSKPRTRRGRRRFTDRLVTLASDHNDDINDLTGMIGVKPFVEIKLFSDPNITLNVRVKERGNNDTRKGPVGSIFKDTPAIAIKGLFRKEPSHELKDTIKRPLTGLFRTPISRVNSKHRSKNENKTEADIFVSETSNHRNEHIVSQSRKMRFFEG